MSKTTKFFMVILIILVIPTSLYQLGRRIGWDVTSKRYTIAFRYDDLSRASSLFGGTNLQLLKKLDPQGESLVLFQKDLATTSEFAMQKIVGKLQDAGITRGVEVTNIQSGDKEEFQRLLNYLKRTAPKFLILRGLHPVKLPAGLKDWIEEKHVTLGTVEFRNNDTIRKLAKRHENRVVRLHRVFEKEVGSLTEVEREARYVRAVEERNIGVIEYRLSLNAGIDEQIDSLRSIRKKLARSGYQITPVGAAKGTGREVSSPLWLTLILITGSIGLVVLLLFPTRLLNFLPVLAGVTLLGTGVGTGLALYPVLTQQTTALLLALLAPVGAFKLVKKFGRSFRTETGLISVFIDFIGLSFYSTFSGIVISSILFDQLFLIKLHQFRGVKLSLFFPLLLLLIMAIHLGELKITRINLTYTKGLAGILLLGLFLLLLVRSGNFGFLSSTDLEETVRRWLDRTFLVRPRFKEFLIGHPGLIAWLYLVERYEDRFQLCKIGLFLVGFIGQVSIINTFVHIHTPITISLIRTANGMIGGAILGAIIVVGLIGGESLWKLVPE